MKLRITVLTGLFTVLVACAPLCMTSAAAARQDYSPNPLELTQGEVDNLRDAWKQLDSPVLSLFVGHVGDDGATLEQRGDQLEGNLRSELLKQLTRACDDVAATRSQPERIPGGAGPGAEQFAAAIRRNERAGVAIFVMLRDNADGTVNVSCELHDLRGNRPVVKGGLALRPIAKKPSLKSVQSWSCSICTNLTKSFQGWATRAPELNVAIRLLGATEKDIAAVTDFLADPAARSAAEIVQAREPLEEKFGVERLTQIEVKTTAKFAIRTLQKKLNTVLKPRKLSVISAERGSLWARVVPDRNPAWYSLTEMEKDGDPNKDFKDLVDKRKERLRKNQNPRVAVIAADGDLAANYANRVRAWFGRLGFEVDSDIKIPIPGTSAEAQAAILNAKVRENQQNFGFVVTIFPANEGRFDFQLLDMRQNQVAGVVLDSVFIPDQRMQEHSIDFNNTDPDTVARFVAGNLVATVDKILEEGKSPRRVVVRFRGVTDIGDVISVSEVFKKNSGVMPETVNGLVVVGELASFSMEVNDSLMNVVEVFERDAAGTLQRKPAVEAVRNSEIFLSYAPAPVAGKEQGNGAEAPAGVAAEKQGQPKKRSKSRVLLIGLAYQGEADLKPLKGTLYDVENIRSTLLNRCGYEEKNIVLMKDDLPETEKLYPSLPNVVEQLRRLKEQAGDGDILMYYSGHGGAPEDNAVQIDMPFLALRSSVGADGRKISGKLPVNEIRGFLESSGARQVVLFLDACRSGGGGGVNPGKNLSDMIANGIAASNVSLVTLSGCRLNQSSLEAEENGQPKGFFTTALCEGLAGAADRIVGNRDGKVTPDELHRFVLKQVAAKTNDKQQPQMAGRVLDDVILADFSN